MDSSESFTELMKQAEHCGRDSPFFSFTMLSVASS